MFLLSKANCEQDFARQRDAVWGIRTVVDLLSWLSSRLGTVGLSYLWRGRKPKLPEKWIMRWSRAEELGSKGAMRWWCSWRRREGVRVAQSTRLAAGRL